MRPPPSLSHVRGELRRCRVALFWPPGYDPAATIPIALGYLEANLPRDRFEVKLFDCAMDQLDASSPRLRFAVREFAPDVVGVSSWSPMFPEALDLVRMARELDPTVITVLGGAHATAYPERCMEQPDVDFIVAGEAERSFVALLDELGRERPALATVQGLVWRGQDGDLHRNEPERLDELDRLARPDYRLIRLDEYNASGYRWNSPPVATAPIWLTRGCPYRCQYCATPTLNGRPIRKHSIEYAVRWIRQVYEEHGVRWFNIIDDNFTYDVKWAKAFCRAVIELDLPVGFGTPNGIRMQRGDPELWALMKQAGWDFLVIAPESGSQKTLQAMKKDLKLEIVPSIVRDIQAAGLRCVAFFIVGYPGESAADIELTHELIRDCRFNFVFLANFQPLPGTPVYDDLVAAGEIRDGLLPFNFNDSVRAYTPPGLEDFNFARFAARTYWMMATSNPANAPYLAFTFLRRYQPQYILKKMARAALMATRAGAPTVEARYL
jgi:anaerobic magnesium-protoporphyrin IX monomethyl ester cyclase